MRADKAVKKALDDHDPQKESTPDLLMYYYFVAWKPENHGR